MNTVPPAHLSVLSHLPSYTPVFTQQNPALTLREHLLPCFPKKRSGKATQHTLSASSLPFAQVLFRLKAYHGETLQSPSEKKYYASLSPPRQESVDRFLVAAPKRPRDIVPDKDQSIGGRLVESRIKSKAERNEKQTSLDTFFVLRSDKTGAKDSDIGQGHS